MQSFKDLGLLPQLLTTVEKQGYTQPTPIQQAAIPTILSGKDLFATAPTGTGKTAAFAMPIIQQIIENPQKEIHSLVLAPTRELAHQIADNFQKYSAGTSLKITLIYGGVSQHRQVDNLKRGCQIVIATPGRLLDLMNQGYVKLHKVNTFVLDECDRMLDMGFIDDIRKIGEQLENTKKQTLLFSATASKEIRLLSSELLNDPEKIDIIPTAEQKPKISQWLFSVAQRDKENLLCQLLEDTDIDAILVFTKTKMGADRLVESLQDKHESAVAIHGDKSQRERSRNLDLFRNGRARILVATDVAARGVDIPTLNYVVNFDMPEDAETYTHRIGRTGRAGSEGLAMSFCGAGEVNLLHNIYKEFGQDSLIEMDHDFRIELPERRSGGGNSRRSFSSRKSGSNNSSAHKGSYSGPGNANDKSAYRGSGSSSSSSRDRGSDSRDRSKAYGSSSRKRY